MRFWRLLKDNIQYDSNTYSQNHNGSGHNSIQGQVRKFSVLFTLRRQLRNLEFLRDLNTKRLPFSHNECNLHLGSIHIHDITSRDSRDEPLAFLINCIYSDNDTESVIQLLLKYLLMHKGNPTYKQNYIC